MKQKKQLIGIVALALIAAIMLGVYFMTRPDVQVGDKTVTVEVVHKDGSSKEFVYDTDEENLGELLLAEGLIEGDVSEFGLYVKAVDGETADFSVDKGWWCLMKGDEMCATGVSETLISDGDRYAWVYTIG